MRIQNTPREQLSLNPIGYHKDRQILLADSQGAFFCYSSDDRRRPGLLYSHSKCLGNRSMRIQNMAGAGLFDHIGAQSNTIGLHDLNSAAHAIF
jgi:hypothetical protein